MRTVGVEEELLVVDAAGVPVPKGPEALEVAARRSEGEDVPAHDLADRGLVDDDPEPGHLMPELKAQQIELGTRVCTDLAELEKELRFWRARAESAANAVGAHVAALATSPVPVQPVATEGERYGRIVEQFARTARDVLTCGCHVHVSVADDEEGVAVLDRIRIWLPVLTALTANSPFWQGEDTGYASYRSQVWLRWPSAGPNEPFGDAAAYRRLVDDVLATGTVLDPGMVYFDARLSATWPTVEVRTADVALRVEDAVLLAGLVRGLVETAARDARDGARSRTSAPNCSGSPPGGPAAPASPATSCTRSPGGRPRRPTCSTALADHVRPPLADAGDEQMHRRGSRDACCAAAPAPTSSGGVHRETGDLAAVVRAAVAITAGPDADRASAARPTRFAPMYTASWRDVVRRDLFGPAPDPRDKPYRFVDRVVLVVFKAFGFRFDVRGSEHVPASGGAIISQQPRQLLRLHVPRARCAAAAPAGAVHGQGRRLPPLVRRPVHARHAAHPGRPQGRRRRLRVRRPRAQGRRGGRRLPRGDDQHAASRSRTSRPASHAWPSTPACRSSRPPSGAGSGSPPRATRCSGAAASRSP